MRYFEFFGMLPNGNWSVYHDRVTVVLAKA